MTRISRKRKALFSLVLVIVGGLLLAIAAEVMLRVRQRLTAARQDQGTTITYVHGNGYYTYRPGTVFTVQNEDGVTVEVRTDPRGLRNPESAFAEAECILLGDSMVAGINTPEANTLAGCLRQRGMRVYNAGMDGFSTRHALCLLQALLQQGARPLKVVLVFYLGNDFHDNGGATATGIADSPAVPGSAPVSSVGRSWPDRIVACGKRSLLVRTVYTTWWRGWLCGDARDEMASYPLAEMMSFRLMYDDRMDAARKSSGELLAAFSRLSQQYGFAAIVVGLPSKAQVCRSFHEISQFGYDPRADAVARKILAAGYSFDRPNQVAAKLAAANGLAYVNLLDVFRARPEPPLFYQLDVHWTAAGQRLAADTLWAAIGGDTGSQKPEAAQAK